MNPDRFEAKEIAHAVSASINDEAIFQGNRNVPASSANFAPNNPEIRPPGAAAVSNSMNTGGPSGAAVVSNSTNTGFEEQTQISPVRPHSVRLHASEVTVVQPTKHQQIFCTGFHRKKLLISGFLFCLVAVIIVGAFLGFLLSSTPTDGPTFLRTTQLTLSPTAGPTISTTAEPTLFLTARPNLFPTAMQQTATPTRNQVTGQADVSCGGHYAISCAECPYNSLGNYMGQGWCNGECIFSNNQCIKRIGVFCGNNQALTCAECPYLDGEYMGWCNGECGFVNNQCIKRTSDVVVVSCGGHNAPSCAECPYDSLGNYMGQFWCNGVCNWNDNQCE